MLFPPFLAGLLLATAVPSTSKVRAYLTSKLYTPHHCHCLFPQHLLLFIFLLPNTLRFIIANNDIFRSGCLPFCLSSRCCLSSSCFSRCQHLNSSTLPHYISFSACVVIKNKNTIIQCVAIFQFMHEVHAALVVAVALSIRLACPTDNSDLEVAPVDSCNNESASKVRIHGIILFFFFHFQFLLLLIFPLLLSSL